MQIFSQKWRRTQSPWKPPSQINEMKRQKLLLNHFAVTTPNIYTTVGNNLDRHVARKIILISLFFFSAIAIMSGIFDSIMFIFPVDIWDKSLYVLMFLYPPYFFYAIVWRALHTYHLRWLIIQGISLLVHQHVSEPDYEL